METLRSQTLDDAVVLWTLESGSGNPLTSQLISSLSRRLVELEAEPPRAVVLSGGTGPIFSGGFDLPTIAPWDRPSVTAHFEGFFGVLHRILRLPCPVIAAMGGHAIAGGFILALACDFRVAGTGKLKFGLSEVNLGVAVPAGAQVLLAARTSEQVARRLSTTGRLVSPDEALRVGLVDEIAEDPLARALDLARDLATKPGNGVAGTKMLRAGALSEAVREAEEAGFEAFLDTWFSPEAQAAIGAMADKLRR